MASLHDHAVVREAMINSFREWGLDTRKREHKQFGDKCLDKVLRRPTSAKSEDDQLDLDKFEDLPLDVLGAIEFVFKVEFASELSEAMLIQVIDNLGSSVGPYAPWYYIARYRHTRSNNYPNLEIRPEFRKFQSSKLDPLRRFSFEKYSSREAYHRQLLSDSGCLSGIEYEGIVASHATVHAACIGSMAT